MYVYMRVLVVQELIIWKAAQSYPYNGEPPCADLENKALIPNLWSALSTCNCTVQFTTRLVISCLSLVAAASTARVHASSVGLTYATILETDTHLSIIYTGK